MVAGGFTLSESLAIGTVCALYQANGSGNIVLATFALTLFAFVTISFFTLQSRIDFGFMGVGLISALAVFVGWGLMNLIFGWAPSFAYSLLGAVLFCLLIVYDTWRLHKIYSVDE